MLRFDSPVYLYLLLMIPVFVGLMVLAEYKRRKAIKKLGDAQLIAQLMPDASTKRRWLKFGALQLALVMLILMVARPQMGTKVSNEKRNGIECIIAMDISNSMLAEDVQPSRLDKSKMLVENLVDKFTNDKIGLVVFAGDAFVQLPITSDYVSAKMFLQSIDPSLIQTQGTDIAQAIKLASSSFTQQDKIGKAIIVITDGEDHEGGASEAAKEAMKKGMNVFILGIGDTNGAPIPIGNGGYLTDNTGNTVMTRLNEQMCREVAAAGKGTYIHVDNTSAAQERLNDELSKLQQGSMKSVVYSEYNEQFQVFGILCVLLLIIEICINETMNPFFTKIRIFKSGK
jgi:Ca-activated chloride channel family protein